ncbi:hypothetical protein HAX54_022424 [Datura stramonium]|uniref:NPH3 domain-containing protein n=1 Tax=Datura stramonium TaxID=4076 RepID=A0ABS8S419_DATST|nr:hypothetical protein [Datura stramonium]
MIESLLHTYAACKLEEVVERSKKAVSVQDKSTLPQMLMLVVCPLKFLDHLSRKTEILSQVELDLAIGVAAACAEEAAVRAKKHALYSAQLESKLEELLLNAPKRLSACRINQLSPKMLIFVVRPLKLLDQLSGKTETLSQDDDHNLLKSEDIGHPGSEACNKRKKINEGKKLNADVGHPGSEVCNKRQKINVGKKLDGDGPSWDLITQSEDKRLSMGIDIYCSVEDV